MCVPEIVRGQRARARGMSQNLTRVRARDACRSETTTKSYLWPDDIFDFIKKFKWKIKNIIVIMLNMIYLPPSPPTIVHPPSSVWKDVWLF